MKAWRWIVAVVCLALGWVPAESGPLCGRGELDRVNSCLRGQVLDYTYNHGCDRRIWSDALGQKRDLYVYLPPGYDPQKKYSLIVFLHGAVQDETYFLQNIVPLFDQAIAEGKLPPTIIAAPDGSLMGKPCLLHPASWWANSLAGNFEDWVMQDVWRFMHENYPLRKDRDSHVLIGLSMGGSAAFAHAIKHKDRVKVAMGFVPALNLRWIDCHGSYWGNFDPACWGWLEEIRPNAVVGRPHPLIAFRFKNLFDPIIGRGPDAIARLSSMNPIEMIDHYNLKPGELDLFVAYGGQDEFNMDAQVESFLYRAKERGLEVGVAYDPCGRHNLETGKRLMPQILEWAAPRIARYQATPEARFSIPHKGSLCRLTVP